MPLLAFHFKIKFMRFGFVSLFSLVFQECLYILQYTLHKNDVLLLCCYCSVFSVGCKHWGQRKDQTVQWLVKTNLSFAVLFELNGRVRIFPRIYCRPVSSHRWKNHNRSDYEIFPLNPVPYWQTPLIPLTEFPCASYFVVPPSTDRSV